MNEEPKMNITHKVNTYVIVESEVLSFPLTVIIGCVTPGR